MSFGVTTYQEGDKVDDILKRADTALYLAKMEEETGLKRFSLIYGIVTM